ncbi:MAG: AzlD domain-containing protein [Clostridia bacterium]|nr:AzlD domain-containing protein [Clostridia bacterium]
MSNEKFLIYLLVMAGVTYLVRMIPMVLLKKKIKNRFVISFLHYIPYAVLSAMTIPACFYATDSPVTAAVGFIVAVVASLFERSLVQVAALSCLGVLATELIMKFI